MTARQPRAALRYPAGMGLLLVLPAAFFLAVFLLFPVAWIVRVSFNQQLSQGYMVPGFTLENHVRFLGDPWYLVNILLASLKISIGATIIDIFLAYPVALFMVRCRPTIKIMLYVVVIAPLLIGIVSLVFGWIVLFRTNGLLNTVPIAIGLMQEPLRYMYDERGVFILLVYTGVPYVVLSLLDNMERIDAALLEAGANVGATRWQCFRSIVFPLTVPGLYAGAVVVFALNFSASAIPLMIGPPQTSMIGLLVYQQAMQIGNLPFAAAVSITMIALSTVTIALLTTVTRRLYLSRLGVA